MIVISHSWEFVPKGSSHLNYHTNSSTNTKSDTNKSAAIGSASGGANNQPEQLTNQQQHQQLNNDKKLGPKKNVRVMINSEFNNSSINDLSFAYWQKTPLINKLNFDQQVNSTSNDLYFNSVKQFLF